MKDMFDNLEKCKYKDCMHIKEDGCYILNQINNDKILKNRYENYLKFINR